MPSNPHTTPLPGATQCFTIGALAQAAGVHVETVRFYQRKGLMGLPKRPPGGIRSYGEADLARLRFIKSAQRMGFRLDEAAELLALNSSAACTQARQRAERKLADVRERLSDLQRVEAELQDLVERCSKANQTTTCPLMDALRSTPCTPELPRG
jgi:MerR family mercuric resistance operon transcriptional regulator